MPFSPYEKSWTGTKHWIDAQNHNITRRMSRQSILSFEKRVALKYNIQCTCMSIVEWISDWILIAYEGLILFYEWTQLTCFSGEPLQRADAWAEQSRGLGFHLLPHQRRRVHPQNGRRRKSGLHGSFTIKLGINSCDVLFTGRSAEAGLDLTLWLSQSVSEWVSKTQMSHFETSNADTAESKDVWNENLEFLRSSADCLLSADCLKNPNEPFRDF